MGGQAVLLQVVEEAAHAGRVHAHCGRFAPQAHRRAAAEQAGQPLRHPGMGRAGRYGIETDFFHAPISSGHCD
jgi:hypothetical protein